MSLLIPETYSKGRHTTLVFRAEERCGVKGFLTQNSKARVKVNNAPMGEGGWVNNYPRRGGELPLYMVNSREISRRLSIACCFRVI